MKLRQYKNRAYIFKSELFYFVLKRTVSYDFFPQKTVPALLTKFFSDFAVLTDDTIAKLYMT